MMASLLRPSLLLAWLPLAGVDVALAGPGPAPEPSAASESTPELAPASTPPAADADPQHGPVAVSVVLEGYSLDPWLVQAAVAKELGVAVTSSPEGAGAEVKVTAKKGGDLHVQYQSRAGAPLLRVVRAPERDDEVAEAVALLVGNLARDQASELVAMLEPKPEAKTAPKPTPPVETTAPGTPATATQERPFYPVNLTLFHPVSVVPQPERARLQVELGLFYSRVGKVDAFSLNPFVLRVHGPSRGGQLAGLVGLNDERGSGARIAGVFARQRGDFDGLQLAGAVSLAEGNDAGLQVGGIVTTHRGPHTGVQVGGVVSVNQGPTRGGAFAGVVNVTDGPLMGVAASGVVNVAGDLQGAQLGLINVGGTVQGLQLGLVNVADDVQGASIGFVTWSRSGRVQPVLWYATTSPVNLGVRFYTGPLYAMPTLGYSENVDERLEGSPKAPTLSPGFSLGGRVPIQRAFVDLEANYSNRAPELDFDEHSIDLRYRLLAGFYVTDDIAPIVGGGVRHHLHTQGGGAETFTPELSVGVQFF